MYIVDNNIKSNLINIHTYIVVCDSAKSMEESKSSDPINPRYSFPLILYFLSSKIKK
jgi:hypothetical protein